MPKDIEHEEWIKVGDIDVCIHLCIEPEHDIRVEHHFSEQADINWVYSQLNAGNQWAWCVVSVDASIPSATNSEYSPVKRFDFAGTDTLGGCSYQDAASFMADGQYKEMIEIALYDLSNDFVGRKKLDYRREDWGLKMRFDRGLRIREHEQERQREQDQKKRAQETPCPTPAAPTSPKKSTASTSSTKGRRRAAGGRGKGALSSSTVAPGTVSAGSRRGKVAT